MAILENTLLLKAHLNAYDDIDEYEGGYLEHLRKAASQTVLNMLNRTETDLHDEYGSFLPNDIIHACLLLAAHWYNQRESVSSVQMHEVPDSLMAIIKPYRKLV